MAKFDFTRRMQKMMGTTMTVPNQSLSIQDIIAKFTSGIDPEVRQPVYYGDDVEEDVLYTIYDGDLSDVQTKYYVKDGAPLPPPEVDVSINSSSIEAESENTKE